MQLPELKKKVIKSYLAMIKNYSVGKPYNYMNILDMINLIEVYDRIPKGKMISKNITIDER